jgi:2-iminoacetate synthase ThiH
MVSLNRDWLAEKVLAGERISPDEALELYRFPLEELGALANARRDVVKAKSYDGRGREIVTYIVDRNINYTNVCNVYCKFCAFYRTERDEDHYVLSFDQIDQKLDELTVAGGVQILMQGGAPPKIAVRVVHRSLASHTEKISAHQYSRIQPSGVSAFCGNISDAAARSDLRIQESRARLDPGRRWRDIG